jgi:hypothetical protein
MPGAKVEGAAYGVGEERPLKWELFYRIPIVTDRRRPTQLCGRGALADGSRRNFLVLCRKPSAGFVRCARRSPPSQGNSPDTITNTSATASPICS